MCTGLLPQCDNAPRSVATRSPWKFDVFQTGEQPTRLFGTCPGTRAGTETLSVRACRMNVLAVISPGLKVLFERVGKPEVINRPDFSQFGWTGAIIACNHVGWADSLWMAYAVYPRQLRYMSKQELFSPSLSRWVLEHVGSIPIDRADPSPSSIKTAVDILQHGGVILIFPSGTRSDENIAFKRGAATVASRSSSTCARLLSRPEADASRASPAPPSNPGDIRVTDPNSGVTLWEGDND